MSTEATLEEHLPALHAVFTQAQRQASLRGVPVLASYALPVPDIDLLSLFERVDHPGADAVFWRDAQADRTMLGWELAAEISASGEERFASVDRQWRQWLADAICAGPQPPLVCGGFRFDAQAPGSQAWEGFGDASLWLMTLVLVREQGQTWLLCQRRLAATDEPQAQALEVVQAWQALMQRDRASSDASPPARPLHDQGLDRSDWQDKVADALQPLHNGVMDKVVLAREVLTTFAEPLKPGRTLARLAQTDPSAYLFAFRRQARCFIGASPERLLKLHEGRVQTLALAGTCRRDADPRRDAQLGQALWNCPKNRHEHAVVVQHIQASLAPWTTTLSVPAAPALQSLSRLQHLSTVIEGRLQPGARLLQLVGTLHPTPAVGGHPRATALSYIRRCEGFDRGWYAAPLGWLDGHGNGEFIVGLRSALLHGVQARLWAGCGLVDSSLPASEYEETCLKLSGMQRALQA